MSSGISAWPGQVRRSVHDDYDGYIIVSFANATLVLSIGETVEEVNDSGFLPTVPTLRVQLLADSSLIQVGGCIILVLALLTFQG